MLYGCVTKMDTESIILFPGSLSDLERMISIKKSWPVNYRSLWSTFLKNSKRKEDLTPNQRKAADILSYLESPNHLCGAPNYRPLESQHSSKEAADTLLLEKASILNAKAVVHYTHQMESGLFKDKHFVSGYPIQLDIDLEFDANTSLYVFSPQ